MGLRLELAGEPLQQAVLGVGELFLAYRTAGANVLELLQHLDHRLLRNCRLHRPPSRERRRARGPVDGGVESVAVSLVLPEVLVHARHEVTAEQVVEQVEPVVVGVVPVDGEVARPDD